jgi:hypothetical protein
MLAVANWSDQVEAGDVESLVFAAVCMWDEAEAAGTQGQRPSVELRDDFGTLVGSIGFGHKGFELPHLTIAEARRAC